MKFLCRELFQQTFVSGSRGRLSIPKVWEFTKNDINPSIPLFLAQEISTSPENVFKFLFMPREWSTETD